MKCEKCGQDNYADASSCTWCGGPLTPEIISNLIPHRDLGQLINHTFSLFGQNFAQFIAISLPVPLIGFVGFLLLPEPPFDSTSEITQEAFFEYFVDLISVMIPLTLLIGLAALISQGATIHAVGMRYLGQKINVLRSYRIAIGKAWILVVAGLVVILGFLISLILMLVLIGIPLGFFLLVSWAFVFPVVMIERAGPISALEGSYNLVKGSRCRVLGIGIVFVLLNMVLGMVVGTATTAAGSFSEPVAAIVSGIFQMLLMQFMIIGLTVVYFDLRSRKNRLTLDSLAIELGESQKLRFGGT